MPDIFLRAGEPNPDDVRLQNPTGIAISGSADVAFGFSLAATGSETFSGTDAEAFGFGLAATGSEVFTGIDAEAFGFSLDAAGYQAFTGSIDVTFGYELTLFGPIGNPGPPIARIAPAWWGLPTASRTPVRGFSDIAFGFGVAAAGEVTEDLLILLLA